MAQFHGSDLEKIEKAYGIRKEEIVGFGANVNPLGLSNLMKTYLSEHLDVICSYPDREYTLLRKAIGDYVAAPASSILVGNGSTELIGGCIRAIHPRRAAVLGPSYSEYERELGLAGCGFSYYDLKENEDFRLDTDDLADFLSSGSFDLLVLCNPNNPTSSAVTSGQLETLLRFCEKAGIWVMVDETYAEFAPSPEEITAIPLTGRFQRLVVLRGVSKFWAAPGLRLGYAVTGSAFLRTQLDKSRDPWTVSSLADAAGQVMFQDQAYIQNTRALINRERERCISFLKALPGVKVYPAWANFILARFQNSSASAGDLFEAAIRQKMMIRDCSGFHGLDKSFFRFCIMLPEDNSRLLKCISVLSESSF